jgi:hypothetical protein
MAFQTTQQGRGRAVTIPWVALLWFRQQLTRLQKRTNKIELEQTPSSLSSNSNENAQGTEASDRTPSVPLASLSQVTTQADTGFDLLDGCSGLEFGAEFGGHWNDSIICFQCCILFEGFHLEQCFKLLSKA